MVFTWLQGPTPATGLCVRVTAWGAVKISTPHQKLGAAELQSQVYPKVMFW